MVHATISSRRKRLVPHWISCLFALALGLSGGVAQAGERLDHIQARGFLACGIYPGVAGFATDDGKGGYSGFDIDTCRAISAAIFGVPDKVKYVTASSLEEFLRTPETDVVLRRLTWTLTREAANKLLFGPITFYDGQGFLARRSLGAKSVKDLSGDAVCVEPGEGADLNLARFSQAHGLGIKEVVIEDHADAAQAFFAGRCQAYSADVTMLASVRSRARNPGEFEILPQQISKEPLAPLMRQGDDEFFEIVRWTVFAMIEAEELGVSSANVDGMRKSRDPDIRRLLGVTPGNGKALGLDEGWAYAIIKSVGNYGEMFDRNLGARSAVKLERGLNRLWTDGGLLYAPPVR